MSVTKISAKLFQKPLTKVELNSMQTLREEYDKIQVIGNDTTKNILNSLSNVKFEIEALNQVPRRAEQLLTKGTELQKQIFDIFGTNDKTLDELVSNLIELSRIDVAKLNNQVTAMLELLPNQLK